MSVSEKVCVNKATNSQSTGPLLFAVKEADWESPQQEFNLSVANDALEESFGLRPVNLCSGLPGRAERVPKCVPGAERPREREEARNEDGGFNTKNKVKVTGENLAIYA